MAGEWSISGSASRGAGRGPEGSSTSEWWKLLLITGLLLACGVSYVWDPWVPTGVEGRGMGVLQVSVDFGVDLRSSCSHVFAEEASCKKSMKRPANDKEKARGHHEDSGFLAFLRQVGGVSPDGIDSKHGVSGMAGSDSGTQCQRFTDTSNQCRSTIRETRQKIQLKCSRQVLALWECRQAQIQDGRARDAGQCTQQQKAMAVCSKPIASTSFRIFTGGSTSR
mmetsp:Transcript_2423/g.7059  ORF Transcript_2423/g.7059 Transcript_2423/m.7059 type:complete len:223 (+) Transcript_2423:111-779(+)